MKNIILCGFMGCGKTTAGKLLAKSLQMEFLDLDEYIESHEGMKIPEIFARFSESGFRDIEHNALKDTLLSGGKVIATGGGALTFSRNVTAAKENGVVIFLRAGFETCYKRISKSSRPLVSSKTKAELEQLLMEREPLYRAACDIEADADNGSAGDVCRRIEALIKA